MTLQQRTAGMSIGRRNILKRLARSRAARDLREVGRNAVAGILLGLTFWVWVMVTAWFIEHGAPALARWLGWI